MLSGNPPYAFLWRENQLHRLIIWSPRRWWACGPGNKEELTIQQATAEPAEPMISKDEKGKIKNVWRGTQGVDIDQSDAFI